MNHETERRGNSPANANADKVKDVIEEICKTAGTPVAIEERLGDGESQSSPHQYLHITYNGEKPMPYAMWFKLINTIDEALESSGLIDWESSELSEESEPERMATWKIAPPVD